MRQVFQENICKWISPWFNTRDRGVSHELLMKSLSGEKIRKKTDHSFAFTFFKHLKCLEYAYKTVFCPFQVMTASLIDSCHGWQKGDQKFKCIFLETGFFLTAVW